MTPGTVTTILNTAQLIVQNADKLTSLIRRRGTDKDDKDHDVPATLEGVRQELKRLHQRLDDNDNASVEQLRFIEQLAQQHELFAETLQKHNRRTQWALVLSGVAAGASIVLAVTQMLQ